jgi:outer membrane protein TolC
MSLKILKRIKEAEQMKFNKVSKISALLLLLNMLTISVNAQSSDSMQVLSLSLEGAIERASESGYQVLIAEREQEAAKAGLSQANMVFLPQLSIEESAVKTNDPIGVFGIKLRQGIIQQSDFNPATLNDPDATHNFTTKFEVRQPILNPEGLFQRTAAKYQAQSADKQLKATMQYARLKVKEVYYQLGILDEQVAVLKQHLATNKAFEKQASDYFEQGMIPKSEYLNARVYALDAEKELLKAENQRKSLNDQLLLLMGMQEELQVKVLDRPQVEEDRVMAANGSMMNASLLAMKHQVEASDAMLKAAKSGFLPNLNVFAAYELHDKSLFGNQADNYMIGASLRWDLFKGFKQVGLVNQRKAESKKAELQFEQQRLNHRIQVKEARRTIDESLKNIELSELAVEQSEEDVRFRSDRYDQGIEKTSDLLLAETKNLKNKLSKLQALYQYQMAVASLEYLLEKES